VKSVMDWVYDNFQQPDTLAFIGCSAGASAVVFTEAARASTKYGSRTRIVAIGDSPSNLVTEKFVKTGLVNWCVSQAAGLCSRASRREACTNNARYVSKLTSIVCTGVSTLSSQR